MYKYFSKSFFQVSIIPHWLCCMLHTSRVCGLVLSYYRVTCLHCNTTCTKIDALKFSTPWRSTTSRKTLHQNSVECIFLVLEKMLVIFSSSDMSVFSGFNTSGTKQPACVQFCTPLEMNTNARMTRILFSPVNGHSTLKCNPLSFPVTNQP